MLKLSRILFALLFLLAQPLWGLSNDPSQNMEKWRSLNEASQNAIESQDLPQALQLAQKAYDFALDEFGPMAKPTAWSTWHLARLRSDQGELDQARKLMKQALSIAQSAFGQHETTYRIMLGYAEMIGMEGNYAEAGQLIEKVYLFRLTKLGEAHPDTLEALAELAESQEALGELEQAQGLLEKGRSQLAQLPEPNRVLELDLLEQSASVANQLGDFAQAQKFLKTAYEIKLEIYGLENAETLITAREYGNSLRKQGQLNEAKELLQTASEGLLKQLGNQDPELFLALAYLGQTSEALGDYGKAEEIFSKVYEFDRQFYGEFDINSLIDLNSLAGIQSKLAKYELAEANYRTSLTHLREILGPSHPTSLALLNNLALLYESRGLYDEAEPLYREAHQITGITQGPSHPTSLALANNLAMLLEAQGSFAKAEQIYLEVIEQATARYGKNNDRTLSFRNNLAYLQFMQEDFAKAAKSFEEIYLQWQSKLGIKHQKTLKALNNQGRALTQLARFEEAEGTLQKALQFRLQIFGDLHPDTIRSEIDLGSLSLSKKEYKKAAQRLATALEKAEKALGPEHPYSFEALNLLTQAQQAAGLSKEALLTAYKGYERRNHFFQSMLWVTGENSRKGYLDLHRKEQDRLLELLSWEKHPVAPMVALDASLKRKGLLLKVSSEIRKVVAMSENEALAEKAKRLEQARKEQANLILKGPAGGSESDFAHQVEKLEEEIFQIELALGQGSKAYRESIREVAVDEVLDSLEPGQALIDFLIYSSDGEDRLMAVVVEMVEESCFLLFNCKAPNSKLIDLGTYDKIQSAVQEFRDAIMSDSSDEEMLADAGDWVYSLLWSPLLGNIQNSKVIYLVPDGVLNILPFDAIPDQEKGGVLLEHVQFKILSSSRDLVIPPAESAEGKFVILAGPDYDVDFVPSSTRNIAKSRSNRAVSDGIKIAPQGLRGLSFDPLMGAQMEGESILAVAQKSNGIEPIFTTGRQAEEQRLREWKSPPQILHIATHGFFLKKEEKLKGRLLAASRGLGGIKTPPPGDNPLLRAGLAFAGINANAPLLGEIDANNDGVLTALEALSLDLYGTDLVVLSACETGLGEIHAGEGVYGLRRAFQEAGVNRVVSSLWEVSDDATRDLMSDFYRRMAQGTPTRQALRESKLELLQSDSWSHPYFWSAFQMVGRD